MAPEAELYSYKIATQSVNIATHQTLLDASLLILYQLSSDDATIIDAFLRAYNDGVRNTSCPLLVYHGST